MFAFFVIGQSHLGIALWRESIHHPKLRENADYRQNFETMCPENQTEELSYQYFQPIRLESRELRALKKQLGPPNLSCYSAAAVCTAAASPFHSGHLLFLQFSLGMIIHFDKNC